MKIDGLSPNSLIDRMREVAGTAVDRSSATSSADASLEANLRVTAERALRGEFDSHADLRGAVVEQILLDRWADRLAPTEVERLIETTKATLSEDPEFARQLDEMLILAARTVSPR